MSNYTIRIERDTEPSNPLEEWSWPGQYMVTAHKRYSLGGENSFFDGESARKRIGELVSNSKGSLFKFPLYMYDHSGQTISLEPFSCPFDSGMLGEVIIDAVEFGEPDMDEARAREIAEGMVKAVDQWMQGDVWGYVIEDEDGDIEDSCWGFYGEEEARKEAESIVKSLEENNATA